jgi:uncharacterized protein involved in oxidation of intracellular sulfur
MGIVLQTNDPETVWNAFRFAITSKDAGHSTRIFLLGKGVELEKIPASEKFDVPRVVKAFLKREGEIYACGTCLEIRGTETGICPVSTMSELLKIVEESDKVLVF